MRFVVILTVILIIYIIRYLLSIERFTYHRSCAKNTEIQSYIFKDRKNIYSSEMSNEQFLRMVSSKSSTFRVEDEVSDLKYIIELWINSFIKKSSNKFEVFNLEKIFENTYVFVLHRPGKNHGKVIEADIRFVDKNKVSIENINLKGVRLEYDIRNPSLSDAYDRETQLQYKKFEDRFQRTTDERILDSLPDESKKENVTIKLPFKANADDNLKGNQQYQSTQSKISQTDIDEEKIKMNDGRLQLIEKAIGKDLLQKLLKMIPNIDELIRFIKRNYKELQDILFKDKTIY